MFYLLGINALLSYRENRWYILISTLSFILSAYSYNSFRIITSLTILILIIFEIKNIKAVLGTIVLPILISTMLLCFSIIPIYRLYTLDSGISRFQAVGIENRWSFLKNYISHFSPDFLFSGDKNLRSQQKGFGQIYFPELILLILGLLYISSNQKFVSLPLALLLLGPIPAAITKESPHGLRAISMVPFMAIISALGLVSIKSYFSRKYFVELGVVAILLLFFLNYFINFITVYPTQSSEVWQYGYKKIFTDPKLQLETKDRILISDRDGQPYIFALFYLKYDPENFRAEVVRNSIDQWGFSAVKSFGRFEFGE